MDGMHGVLIYTASGDSEGSLGGLTSLAQSDKLYPIILRALENMSYCSSDQYVPMEILNIIQQRMEQLVMLVRSLLRLPVNGEICCLIGEH